MPDRLLMITYSAVKGLAVWVFLAILGVTTPASFAGDYNSLVLEQIGQMPQGGRYSVSHFAKIRLQSSAHLLKRVTVVAGRGMLSLGGAADPPRPRATHATGRA